MDSSSEYHEDFNNAETEVLTRELANSKVLWWLRSTDRKSWALCVPYEVGGETRATFPDFLLVRSDSGRLVVDIIIDPHTISVADAPAKAAGLAKFAAQHFDKFGRIELILIDGKVQSPSTGQMKKRETGFERSHYPRSCGNCFSASLCPRSVHFLPNGC